MGLPELAGADPKPNESPVADFDWDELLSLIEEGQVIPIVGEALSTVRVAGQEHTLHDLIAQRLSSTLKLPAGEAAQSLHRLACCYVGNDLTRLDSLYAKIKASMPKPTDLALPDPLVKLAAIRHFRLYVTTTFDWTLAAALIQERHSGTPINEESIQHPPFDVLAYRPGKIQDLPCQVEELERTVVYHLFGKVSSTPDYAVTDEDVLEFIHQLQSKEQQPPRLFDALSTHRLLIIGCRFTNWLARFFLRMARSGRLRMPGKSDYLVSQLADADRELVVFLQHFGGGTRVIQWSAVEFVNQLHHQWTVRYGATTSIIRPKAPNMAGTVFISYASEDRDVAQRLRDLLETNGLTVWFDKDRLRGGDRWAEVLKGSVGNCSVFVPIISRHCLTPENRYFRLEWDWALETAKLRPANMKFVNPIVIDDTSDQDNAIPGALRAIQWSRYPGGAVDRAFVDDLAIQHQRYPR